MRAWACRVVWSVAAVLLWMAPGAALGQTCGQWSRVPFAEGMEPRGDTATVYDSARQRVILFGGFDGLARNDTWSWDGVSWTKIVTAHSPPVRAMHAMAYDAARDRVVVFGGRNESTAFGDTWEFDGTDWAQVGFSGPSARYTAVMAYDAARARVVLFGGFTSAGGQQADTWLWDGASWTFVSSGTPSRRNNHGMAFDSGRNVVVMLGGFNGTATLNETWEWNGASWSLRAPTTSPGAISNITLAFDAARQRTVLFTGGVTWLYDGVTWQQAAGAGGPASGSYHRLAYDAARQRVVQTGGNSATRETWEWDGAAWARITGPIEPPGRTAAAAAFDALRGRVVMFGGATTGIGRLGDTWAWDGDGWEQLAQTGPAPRNGAGMAYDETRDRLVLFGGNNSTTRFTDTWAFDGTAWANVTPATGSPVGRSNMAVARDPVRDRIVMFGGLGAAGNLNQTWEWDGAAWLQRTPANSPSARYGTAMAYDAARGRMVLFGGFAGTSSLNDTWEWDGINWTQRATGGPGIRGGHALAYDPSRGRVVAFGGSSADNSVVSTVRYTDAWEWNGSAWTLVASSGPISRTSPVFAYDAVRGRGLLFGGSDPRIGFAAAADTWNYLVSPPLIIEQPPSVVEGELGGLVTLSVGVSNPSDTQFQWRKGGQPVVNDGRIGGASGPGLTFSPMLASDAGAYDCVVSNACGSRTTTGVQLNAHGPDLVGEDVAVGTAAPAIGQSLQVGWTERNMGDRDASVFSWNSRVVFSINGLVGDADDVMVGGITFPQPQPQPQGGPWARTAVFTLPTTLVLGSYRVFVVTDNFDAVKELNEANNVAEAAATVSVGAPDLVVESVTVSPTVGAGEVVSVQWTERNAGDRATPPGSWRWQAVLSRNATLGDADDTVLSSPFTPPGALAAGGSAARSINVTIPSSAALGGYTLFVRTDTGLVVAESNESNNVGSAGVSVSAPDLTVDSLTATPGIPGKIVEVTWTEQNQGSYAAFQGSWLARFTVSANAVYGDADDVAVGGVGVLGPIGVGAAVNRSGQVALPSALAFGTYTLFVLTDAGNEVAELDDGNNVASATLVVSAPDLVIEGFTAPGTLAFGQSFTAAWTERNAGDRPADRVSWRGEVVLSTNGVLGDGDDVVVGSSTLSGNLAAGATAARAVTAQIPAAADAGAYTLFVRTDAAGDVLELDESNNASAPRAVTVGGPDLAVIDLAVPSEVTIGQTVTIAWTDTNRGLFPAAGGWVDRVVLSADATLGNGDDRLLAQSSFGATLAASASAARSAQVNVPSDLAPGAYSVFVITDAAGAVRETDETNNAAGPAPAAVSGPDLVVESVTASPATIGQSVSVTWIERNNGGRATLQGSWIAAYTLSTNVVLGDADDVPLGQSTLAGPLAAGATASRSASVALPLSVSAGVYTLFVRTDAASAVSELDEVNNVGSAALEVGGPDLRVTGVSGPGQAVYGPPFQVQWTTANAGDRPTSAAWTERLVLSANAVAGDADDRVLASVPVPGPLAASANVERSAACTLPGDLARGQYTLFVTADSGATVLETDESNNTSVPGPVATLLVAGPDLAVESISPPPTATAGNPVTIAWTLRNTGNAPAEGFWSDQVFLSADAAAGSDQMLGGLVRIGPVGAGSPLGASQAFTLPADLEGDFWIVVRTDAANNVNEGPSEDNNTLVSASPIHVTQPPLADLVVDSITAPSAGFAGETMTITWQARNAGTATASGSWLDRVHFSADAAAGNDTPAGFAYRSLTLAAGATYPGSAQVSLPGTPGTYYVVVVADADDLIEEGSREGNNTLVRVAAVEVQARPRADLAGEIVLSPGEVQAGSTAQVSWRVTNVSTDTAAVGSWSDALYLSSDTTIDSSDTLLRVNPAGLASLAPGALYTRSASVTIPVDYQASVKYVLLAVDQTGTVDEASEANNRVAGPPVTVTPTPAPNLRVTAGASPASTGVFGQPIDLTFTVTNAGDRRAGAPWTDTVFISADPALSPQTDVPVDAVPNTGDSLNPSSSYTRTRQVTPPVSNRLPAGDYYLIVKADGNGGLEESDEADNTRAIGPIHFDRPDLPNLSVVSVSAPATAAAGDTATVSVAVTNDGDAPAASGWKLAVFAADGPGGTPSGSPLLVTTVADALGVGQGTVVTRSVAVPDRAGESFVFTACLDTADAVVEQSETDNCGSSPGVAFQRPDLATSAVSFDRSSVVAGQNVAVSWTVTNAGAAPARPFWTDAVSLSVDAAVGSDRLVGSSAIGQTVQPGGSYTRMEVVRIPDDAEGVFHAVVGADAGDAVRESGPAGNNAAASAGTLTVTQPERPDLRVTAVLVPAPGVVGAEAAVQWTVTNQSGAPATGIWVDRLYASLDQTIDASDVALGESPRVTPVAAGAAYTGTATVPLPGLAGAYYLLVRTDAAASVNEGANESNNDGASPSTFLVSGIEVAVSTALEEALAGASVPVVGTAFVAGTTTPAENVPITVRARVRGFEKRLDLRAGAGGQFSGLLRTTPTAGGRYALDAGAPAAAFSRVQDQFVLWATDASPAEVTIAAPAGGQASGSFTISNLTDLPLTGVAIAETQLPDGFTVDAPMNGGPVMAPGEQRRVDFVVHASTAAESGRIVLEVTSDKGTSSEVAITVSVSPNRPRLIALTPTLSADMVVGQRQFVQAEVRNVGSLPTSNLLVQFASAPWLNMVTPATLPPLNPGENASVVLELAPALSLPLGPYTANPGVIVTDANDGSVNAGVNFRFNAVSERRGDLEVRCTSEFSYHGQPPSYPSGAEVSLRTADGAALVASAVAGDDGTVRFDGLLEGYYRVEARASRHGGYSSNVLVRGGDLVSIEAFLPRQTVTYEWTVEPVDFEDEYRVVINAVFETNVPAPVVTVEPNVIDFTQMTSCSQFIELEVTNHGLIAADNFRFNFGTHPRYALIPLTTNLGRIPAVSTVSVPCLMIDRARGDCSGIEAAVGGTAAPSSRNPLDTLENCVALTLAGLYDLLCGTNKTYDVAMATKQDFDDCPSVGGIGIGGIAGGGGGGGGGGGFGGGGPGGITQPPAYTTTCVCNPQAFRCLSEVADQGNPLDALKDKVVEQIERVIPGLGCALSFQENCEDVSLSSPKSWVKCLGDGALGCIPGVDAVLDACKLMKACAPQCATADERKCGNDGGSGGGGGGGGGGGAPPIPGDLGGFFSGFACKAPCSVEDLYDLSESLASGRAVEPTPLDPVYTNFQQSVLNMTNILGPYLVVFGSSAWLQAPPGEEAAHSNLVIALGQFQEAASDEGARISAAERAQAVALPRPSNLTQAAVEKFIDRVNRTIDYASAGIHDVAQVPAGLSTDFIARDRLMRAEGAHQDAVAAELAAGNTIIGEGLARAYALLQLSQQPGQGVCASVTIQIEQRIAITRSAFRANLKLTNGGSSDSLEAIGVTVRVRDELGADAGAKFVVMEPTLTGLNDVSGAGTLAPGAAGSAAWLLIPKDSAAPSGPTRYFVSGEMTYTLAGQNLSLPMFPVEITVLPNASLQLHYFLEKEVYSDDPFTPEVEPAVPFSLGLLAQNTGAGAARNVRITTSQPEIVDNERGLAIDFRIVGTQVGDQAASPSLNVNLGDIAPGESGVALWRMLSTLQGQFVRYSASVESLNGFNDPDTSIIDSIDIHELRHAVRADSPYDDGVPDFLTNETPDPRSLPDHARLSTGAIEPVQAIIDPARAPGLAPLTYEINAPVGAGYSYIRIDDPFGGALPLLSCVRSDGKVIRPSDNVWQTSRINRSTPSPEAERYVHIFDHAGTGRYTLTFSPDADPPGVSYQSIRVHGAGSSAAEIGIPLPLDRAGVECREGGVSQILVTFNEQIRPDGFVPGNVFLAARDADNHPASPTGLTVTTELSPTGRSGVIRFSPPLPDQRVYCLRLIDVKDVAGNALAGSGRVKFAALAGDITGDSRVNNTDVGAAASLLSSSPPFDPAAPLHAVCDVNHDGALTQADLAIIAAARRRDMRFAQDPCFVGGRSGMPGSGGDAPPLRPIRRGAWEVRVRDFQPLFAPGDDLPSVRTTTPAGDALESVIGADGFATAAVRRADGAVVPIGTLGGRFSVAVAMNVHGQVAGYSETITGDVHAFRYTPGQPLLDLGDLGGARSWAADINDDGDVTGRSVMPAGSTEPYLFSGAAPMAALGNVGGPECVGLAIDAGRRVAGSGVDGAGRHRAVLWSEGPGLVDLNDALPPGSGWQLTAATGIAEDGAVMGTGVFEGTAQAFRLYADAVLVRCRPDIDGSGAADLTDLFAFLQRWFGASPEADYNADHRTDLIDIFDFLREWFAGCP